MILYLHGFASTGNSWKAGELKKYFSQEDIINPTLPVNPEEVVTFIEREIEQKKPRLLVGSSLGGFYAYYASRRFEIPAALINPSITPWVTLKDYVGINKRYYTGETFEWKEQYLQALKEIGERISRSEPKHHLLHFFLSADDEVLDLKVIPRQFPGSGSIRFFENCGHSFSRFAEILPEIERLVKRA